MQAAQLAFEWTNQMTKLNGKRKLHFSAIFITFFVVAGMAGDSRSQTRGAFQVPKFQVDPFWPKPLPNHWVLGSVTGVAVDRNDHIWIVHRGADSLGNNEKGGILKPPTGCCVPAPPVLEFDQAGNLLAPWARNATAFPPGAAYPKPKKAPLGLRARDTPTPPRARLAQARQQPQDLRTHRYLSSRRPANFFCRSGTPEKLKAMTVRLVLTGRQT